MRLIRLGALALCAVIGGPVGAQTDDGAKAAAEFGVREAVQDISLSPDGTRVAFIAPDAGQGARLFVATINGAAPTSIFSAAGGREQLSRCNWATNDRLICYVYIIKADGDLNLAYTRALAINADGSNMKLLSTRASARALGVAQNGGGVIDLLADDGTILMTRDYVPEDTGGTLLAEQRSGLGVDRVDITTLKRQTVEQPKDDAADYISDGHGAIRIKGFRPRGGTGYNASYISYVYRKANEKTWQKLGTLTFNAGKSTGFDPYAVDPDLNVAYGYDDAGGRTGLYRIALDDTLKRDLVFSRPDVDVGNLIRIGRERRVVGVNYVTDKRYSVFFDPQLKALASGLSKALPGNPQISFVDASAGEKQLLLWAGSDVDPGRYYLFDKATKKVGEVLSLRPQLAATPLAKVTPVSYPAADGTMIPGYLTLPPGSNGKNLPAIVMPHGGPSYRDEGGFDWLAQFFANRGFAVLQPNFRGSTGYGDAWFKDNGFKSWRTAVGDVNDGGRWLIAQGIAVPARLAIVGWSYGGYAALQSQMLDADLFKAIVAIAPVTDLEVLREQSRNYSSFKSVDAFIGNGPHIAEGSPARHAEQMKAPVLLFHGDIDKNVDVEESRLMASRLKAAGKKIELVEFHNLDHQLDDSAARTQMLARADAFLRTSLGL